MKKHRKPRQGPLLTAEILVENGSFRGIVFARGRAGVAWMARKIPKLGDIVRRGLGADAEDMN